MPEATQVPGGVTRALRSQDEIGDLHGAVRTHQHGVRGRPAVGETVLMHRSEPERDLPGERGQQCEGQREGTVGGEFRHAESFRELRDHTREAVVDAVIEDGDHVGMPHRAESARLVHEAPAVFGPLEGVRVQRHRSAGPGVLRLPHRIAAAPAQPPPEPVSAEDQPSGVRRGVAAHPSHALLPGPRERIAPGRTVTSAGGHHGELPACHTGPRVDQRTGPAQELGRAVVGGAGQRAQQHFADTGSEGVRAGRSRHGDEQTAEDDLRQVLRLRPRLDRGLHETHHGQHRLAHRHVSRETEGLGRGEGAKTQHQLLGRDVGLVGPSLAVDGCGRGPAGQQGHGTQEFLLDDARHQPRPGGQPGRRWLQDGHRKDVVGEAVGRVRVHGVPRVGSHPPRRGDPGRQRRQGRRTPKTLRQRLQDRDRHARRPAAQGPVPAVPGRALPPLRPHAVADEERDRAARRVRPGSGRPRRAVGAQPVQLHHAEHT